ncbi:MAG TPA: hypothetical protein VGO76_08070 [Luteibacter sp.]|jgi:uncharacterized protein YodC (DUF2158 family)|nr:hypothetical protein [Luteibacter sp.]
MAKFSQGDLVQHRAAGMVMVVHHVVEFGAGHGADAGSGIQCCWFLTDRIHTKIFDANELTHYLGSVPFTGHV